MHSYRPLPPQRCCDHRAPAASEAEGPTGIGAQYITGGRVAGALIGVARVRKAF